MSKPLSLASIRAAAASPLFLVVFGAAFLLCFTSFYWYGIAAVVVFMAWQRSINHAFFASYIARLVAGGLLTAAIIMIVAMYCWLLKMPLHPLAILAPLLVVYLLTAPRAPEWITTRSVLFDRDDGISFALALVGICLIVISYGRAGSIPASTVQLLTNGFDSAAHYSLIETTYMANGYRYGSYQDIRGDIGWETLTAYPQGWHVANSFTWKGMGIDVYDGSSRTTAVSFYVASFLIWFVAALYLLARAGLAYLRQLGMDPSLKKPAAIAGFCAAHLTIQMAVYWGSLQFGFAPFIGALAYVAVFVICLAALHAKPSAADRYTLHGVAILSAGAIGLTWLLPVPVLALMYIAAVATVYKGNIRKWDLFGDRVRLLLLATVAVLVSVSVTAMMMVSRLYSTQGPSQINDEGGVFGLSPLFVASLLATAALGVFRYSKNEQNRLFCLAIIAPQLLFVGAVYAYQLLTLGHTAYFYTKSLAFLVVITSIFLLAAATYGAAQLHLQRFQMIASCLVIVMAVIGVTAFTNQDISSIKGLLHRSAQLSDSTARVYAELIASGEASRRNVIVYTRPDYGGDVNGNVLGTVLNKHISQCVGDAIWLITDHRGVQFGGWLNNCVREVDAVTVITSPQTYDSVAAYHNPHVRVIKLEE